MKHPIAQKGSQEEMVLIMDDRFHQLKKQSKKKYPDRMIHKNFLGSL